MSSEGFAHKAGEDAAAAPFKYSAFISYNHRDRKQVSWLHRALEHYVLPRHLRGRPGPCGPLGAHLPPVFRDREELAASSDLAQSVMTALEQAYSLIVVCSPNGARSKWVNDEIRAFAALGRAHRIQCVVVGGSPHASERGNPDDECFPRALFEHGRARPLAADLRPNQDGPEAVKLKLIAGILGIGYDDLKQREQARKARRMTLLAGGFGAGFAVMTALAGVALVSRNEAVRQRDIAREKTLTAERTVGFVKSLFEVADPSETRGETITVREILDRGARQLEGSLNNEPTVKAELGTTLGEVYTNLGLLRQGSALIQGNLALLGVKPETRARQLVVLGDAQWQQSDYQSSAASHRRALALLGKLGTPDPALAARARVGLGNALSELGDHKAAETNLRAALVADLARVGPTHLDVARDLEALGRNAFFAGDLAAARRDLQKGMELRTRLAGATHPLVIQDQNDLASVAYVAGDLTTAETYYRRALAGYEAVLGPEHPDIASALNNLGRVLLERRRFAAAEPLLQRAVDVDLAQRDATAADLAFEFSNLGIAKRGVGKAAEADALFARAEAAARLHKHRNLAPILVERAELACGRSAWARGLALLDEAAPIMREVYAEDPWRSAWLQAVRADCLAGVGRSGEAARLLTSSRGPVSAKWSPETLYGARLAMIEARVSPRT